MARDAKLNFLAQVMTDRHGENAAMVVRQRITECSTDEIAWIWRELLVIIESRQLESISPP
jgi:hypothetical protein